MAKKLPRPLSSRELTVHPQKAGGQTKTHKFWQTPRIIQERAAISQDAAKSLTDSTSGQIAEVLKKKGQPCNIDSMHKLNVTVNKSL